MKSSDFQKLTRDDFPHNDFFEHLEKGTDFYQKFNYRRSIEELAGAGVLRYSDPLNLKKINGRIAFRGSFEEVPFLFMLFNCLNKEPPCFVDLICTETLFLLSVQRD